MSGSHVWYTFLVVVGATSIAAEIVGLRLLAPLFGSSLPVWGMAIAMVLAGLAWGYHWGSAKAENVEAGQAMGNVYGLAAVGATMFLWMPVAFMVASYFRQSYLDGGGLGFIGVAFLLAYLALLVPSIVFGMVNPLAVQAESDWRDQPAGVVAGRVSAITTWGSLAGILLPSLVMVPFLGSRVTVWVFAGLVWGFCGWWLVNNAERWGYVWWWAAAAVMVTLLGQQMEDDVLLARETRYQHVEVVESEAGRVLQFDGGLGIQSILPDGLYTRHYWDYLAALPAVMPERSELAVLVVGAGASTTERQMERFWGDDKHLSFTSVEVDGALFTVAENYFDPPERKRVAADGRSFLAGDTERYDLIVIDAYARELSVPFHLATREFFGLVEQRLTTGGVVAINLNAGDADSLWVRSMARTLEGYFPKLRLVDVPGSCNYVLLASREMWRVDEHVPAAVERLVPALEESTRPKADGWLLTDNRVPTGWLGLGSILHAEGESCGS